MYCRIIPKWLARKDICELSDDGNPGAFNVFKHCGKGMGMLCLSLDVLKGLIPVLLASIFMNTQSWVFALVMFAPVLGHAVGLFNHRHGGKCIAVSFGVMFGILPVTRVGIVSLAVIYIFFSTAIKINPNSKRSIIVYADFGLISLTVLNITGLFPVAAGCALIALTAIVKHVNKKVAQEE